MNILIENTILKFSKPNLKLRKDSLMLQKIQNTCKEALSQFKKEPKV